MAGSSLSHSPCGNKESTFFLNPPADAVSTSFSCALKAREIFLQGTAEADDDYMNGLIFFGESTTAHLRAREVLPGGRQTTQVWADDSGTRMLSSQGLSTPIVYPETGEHLTISQACAKKRPRYLVLSFGINGITGFVANKQRYVDNYKRLIQTVQTASPETRIILQTVYPVRTCGGFSVDVDTLNSHIHTLNGWLPEIAEFSANVRVADTASVLRGSDGRLLAEFDAGDGLHLNQKAYQAVLHYLSTHAWQEGEI